MLERGEVARKTKSLGYYVFSLVSDSKDNSALARMDIKYYINTISSLYNITLKNL